MQNNQSKNIPEPIDNELSTMVSFEVPIQKGREENTVFWYQDYVSNNNPSLNNFETKKPVDDQFKFEEMIINETLGFLKTLERESRPIPKFYASKPEDLIVDTNIEVTEATDISVNEISGDQQSSNSPAPSTKNKEVKQLRQKRTITARSSRSPRSPRSPKSPKSPRTPTTPRSPKTPPKRAPKKSDSNGELTSNSTSRKRKAPRTTKRKKTTQEDEKEVSNMTPSEIEVGRKPERKRRQYKKRVPATTTTTNNNNKNHIESTSSSSALLSPENADTSNNDENVVQKKLDNVNTESGKKRGRTSTKNSPKEKVATTNTPSTPSLTSMTSSTSSLTSLTPSISSLPSLTPSNSSLTSLTLSSQESPSEESKSPTIKKMLCS